MSKKLALTIAGGGVRSTASVGVIKYLEENNIKIDAISGTSAGAIVAILYAYGLSIKEIEEVVLNITFKSFIDISPKRIMSLKTIEDMLNNKLKNKERKIPLEIAITNKKTNKIEYFKNKDKDTMIQAVLASSALSLVFSPVKIGNIKYKDGGYSDNLPYINFHNEGYLTLAIKTNFDKRKQTIIRRVAAKKIKYPNKTPDYLLRINNIKNITTFDMNKGSFVIKNGYRTARDKLDIEKIKRDLSK